MLRYGLAAFLVLAVASVANNSQTSRLHAAQNAPVTFTRTFCPFSRRTVRAVIVPDRWRRCRSSRSATRGRGHAR